MKSIIITFLLSCIVLSCVKESVNSKPVYTVTFLSEGQSKREIKVEEEKLVKAITNLPSREGYDFVEWQINNKTFNFDTSIKSDLTLSALWKKKSYVVTFLETLEGSLLQTIKVDYGDKIEESKVKMPVRFGYKFLKWKTSQGGFSFDQIINQPTTVYADWIKTYIVIFLKDKGGVPLRSFTVEEGKPLGVVNLPDLNLKVGYQFKKWVTSLGDYSFLKPISKSLEVYPEWVKVYKIHFKLQGGAPALDEQKVNDGELAKAPNNPSRAGYTFKGWKISPSGSGSVFNFDNTVVNNDISLYAQWQTVFYMVTFDAQGGSTISSVQTNNQGKVEAPRGNPTKTDYTFVKWQKGGVDFDFNTVITGDIILQAVWRRNNVMKYTVAFDAQGGSTISSVQTNDQGKVEAPRGNPTKTDYTFVKWQKEGVDFDFNTIITGDITLQAVWRRNNVTKYTVAFDTQGGSTISSVQTNDQGKVEAPRNNPTKTGYTFVKWQKGGVDFNFATVITENITLQAVWKKNTSPDKHPKPLLKTRTTTTITLNIPEFSDKIKWGTNPDGSTPTEITRKLQYKLGASGTYTDVVISGTTGVYTLGKLFPNSDTGGALSSVVINGLNLATEYLFRLVLTTTSGISEGEDSVGITTKSSTLGTPIVLAYFPSYSENFPTPSSKMRQTPSYINHIFLSFAKPNMRYTKGSYKVDAAVGLELPYNSAPDKIKESIQILKEKGIKVILSIGGETYWRTNEAYNIDYQSIKDFVDDFNLDGIDWDYEPSGSFSTIGNTENVNRFITMIRESRKIMPKGRYLITCAPAGVGALGGSNNDDPKSPYAYSKRNTVSGESDTNLHKATVSGTKAISMYGFSSTGHMIPVFKAVGNMLDMVAYQGYNMGTASNRALLYDSYAYYGNIYGFDTVAGVHFPNEPWGPYYTYTHQNVAELSKHIASNVKSGKNDGMMIWQQLMKNTSSSAYSYMNVASRVLNGEAVASAVSKANDFTVTPYTGANPDGSFTVTFDTGKDATTVSPVKTNAQGKISEPNPSPTKAGYKLVEWQKDGNKFNFGSPVNAKITLKAVWVKQRTLHCGIEEWSKDETYATAKTKAYYQGKIWQNKWWTKGDSPSAGGVWEELSPCTSDSVSLESPTSAATDQAITPRLSWKAPSSLQSTSGLTYNVYLGKTNPPTSRVASNLTSVSHSISNNLDYDTVYYWKVTTANGGKTYESLVRSFKTIKDPNTPPTIRIIKPSKTIYYSDNQSFQITLELEVTDAQSSVSTVDVTVSSNKVTLTKSGNVYSGTYTTTKFGSYAINIVATDDTARSSTKTKNINVFDNNNKPTYPPVPTNVLVGYWHNWDNTGAPFMKLTDIPSEYNVICVSFIETSGNPHTPVFSLVSPNPLNYTEDQFKADIKTLQGQGRRVLISIGGQNGHVELNTDEEKNTYVSGVVAIIKKYGFDGVDIDYEGGTISILNNTGGTSLSYSGIKNTTLIRNIRAVQEIHDSFPDGFMLTAAPEINYVQDGKVSYPGSGQFLAFVENLRSDLDFLQVQLYNYGTKFWSALDGKSHSVENTVVAATEMLIKGFDLGTTGIHFNGLRENQVVVALPSGPRAAGGGVLSYAQIEKAMNYLLHGTTYSGATYTLRKPSGGYNLRGMMTWSINWDKATSNGTGAYAYRDVYKKLF